MLKIKDTEYRIIRNDDHTDSGIRHLYLVVAGDLRDFINIEIDFNYHDEQLTGVVLMPHYCKEFDTTMLLIYVEEE